ncbi:hypothetical protein L1049_023319 [Liquidambar formosana]|uniref:Uncharacterized protein n=1 Tax=Liquidambar formosana TaxID=63359 RepID=A0AAP0RT59_LIQFO
MALHLHFPPLRFSVTHDLAKQNPQQAFHGGRMARYVPCMASTTTDQPTVDNRRNANYQPSIWTHDFMESLKNDYADEIYKGRVTLLEKEVRNMIEDENAGQLEMLELIDDIQRLGLGYHFKKDIRRALDKLVSLEGSNGRTPMSLHGTALRFRLLRQHGYEVSEDVFKSFMDPEGNFMASISEDIKGMLSLYEASYLAFEGESLMDEALAFTTKHLKDHKGNISNSLAELVSHALEIPLHHRTKGLEARWYIEAYNKREGANDTVLELAKLNFNFVQSTLQRDIGDMSRWWKGVGLANELNFARDRLMECFFWTVGMVFEPEFSNCRKGLTKVTALITVIDDIYDVYGSVDELELFTDAVERWDVNAVKSLPDYMKLCYLALYNSVNEMGYDALKDKGENAIPYLTKAWADLCKAFFLEAKWTHGKQIPTFEDYLNNAWVSVSAVAILTHAYFAVTENITKEALEGLEKYHDLLRWPSMIYRLCNDLGTSAAELERGELASSIVCYMHETGLSEEHARKHINGLVDSSWKKLNRYLVDDSQLGKPFVAAAFNLARITQFTYQDGDGLGTPDVTKNRVRSLIVEPIPLNPVTIV